jgi:3-carboxy-cis,cis-muconate cycloisomerase
MISTFLDAVAGDLTIEAFFSKSAEIETMLAFEAALARAQADLGLIPTDAAVKIETACHGFAADPSVLSAGMARDGVVGPAFVTALRATIGEEHGKWLHWGATSQDLVDTGLVLRLKQVVSHLEARLADLIKALQHLRGLEGGIRLMAQTRMQRALPFTAADKIDTWLRPLERNRLRLHQLLPRILVVQFGGPIGTRSNLDGRGDLLADKLAELLHLQAAPAWHTARDGIVELGNWLSLVSGTLGKIGADTVLMAQNEVDAVRLPGGSSSAMPHKSNPVVGEILVALARFNAGLAGTLNNALVHENERSGSAWALEWLVLPQMAVTTAAALSHARRLANDVHFVPDPKI